MPERPCPRLLVVASAPEPLGGRITGLLASLGVLPLPPPVHVALNELVRAIATAADGRTLREGALRAAVGSAEMPAVAAWRLPAVDASAGALLESIAGAGVEVSTIVAWQDPCTVSAATPGPARPLALARWELSLVRMLGGVRHRRCLVLPPGSGPEVRAALAASLAHEPGTRPPAPDGGSASAPASQAGDESLPPSTVEDGGASEHAGILWSQRSLAQVLRELEGSHASLAPVELPAPSGWTVALDDADRRARAAAADAADAWRSAREQPRPPTPSLAEASWHAISRVSRRMVGNRSGARRGPS